MTTACRRLACVLALGLLVSPGCGSDEGPPAYGKRHSDSINGTAVFANLFVARGHEVRSALRLNDEMLDWADVIVRFAPAPGPPPVEEAAWYVRWLNTAPGRRIVYVTRDYDASLEYWDRALEDLPSNATPRTRERIKAARVKETGWANLLPQPPKKVASADDWFAVKPSQAPQVCKALGGPWSIAIDPAKAALTRHEPFKVDAEEVLLSGDGEPLVITWERYNDSRVLAVAGGSFLLNLPLVVRARWPLAEHALEWAEGGESSSEEDRDERLRNVAFVEGAFVLEPPAQGPSIFALMKIEPFGFVAAQILVLGLAACLARAPRLGRPKPDESSGADRPVAHPEALGALLASTGQAREARSILETYRRWRNGPAGRGPTPL